MALSDFIKKLSEYGNIYGIITEVKIDQSIDHEKKLLEKLAIKNCPFRIVTEVEQLDNASIQDTCEKQICFQKNTHCAYKIELVLLD